MRVALLTVVLALRGSRPASRRRTGPERATPGQFAHDGHAPVPGRQRRRRPAEPPAVHGLARRRRAHARDAAPTRRRCREPPRDRVVLPHLRDAAVVARLLLLLRQLRATRRCRAPASTGGAARSTSRTPPASSRFDSAGYQWLRRNARPLRVRAPGVGRTRRFVTRAVALGAPLRISRRGSSCG